LTCTLIGKYRADLGVVRVNGYYNGIKTIVPLSHHKPEYPSANLTAEPKVAEPTVKSADALHPVAFQPYPNYTSSEYLAKYRPVNTCFLDKEGKQPLPDVFHYAGVPQYQPDPLMGSYKVIGLRDDMCWDRFGRYGPYGFGYSTVEGGSGEGLESEFRGSNQVWQQMGQQINWHGVDWAEIQGRCFDSNKDRFRARDAESNILDESTGLQAVSRTAIVVRTWTGFEFTPQVILNFRAMITELALHSGGEYSLHFLVHVKDNQLPIYADDNLYYEVLNNSVPEEFRGMVTLWSEKQMELVYSSPFGETFDNPSHHPIHGVYRSPHLPLQYFANQHPEYDYFWNWEMDMRYTGHFYEFFDRLSKFGAEQPRKGMWERSGKYYIPALHGTWEQFTELVRVENEEGGNREVLGPVMFPGSGKLEIPNAMPSSCAIGEPISQCGVGEEADLITLNPIFDPNGTRWFFENDVTGYDLSLGIPPRRTAIVTAGRMSKRLLKIMHEETYRNGRSMFPEMWAPSVALHHGLKAVYAPHPVFMDRKWPLEEAEHIFNGGKFGSTGGNESSVFGQWEHNFQGSSWYYNSGFAGALWRRWLGYAENGEGGRDAEIRGQGRMCLRSVLVHPIKFEIGPK
jgi:hypothetical protein